MTIDETNKLLVDRNFKVGAVSRMQKMQKEEWFNGYIECLPDELLFNILVRVSADDICNGAILVCRKWYHIIRRREFVRAHLQHSTPGLLIMDYSCRNKPLICVAIRKGQIEVSKFSYRFREHSWWHSWDSCNGLIMEHDLVEQSLHIRNPAIKKLFEIPPFPRRERTDYWCRIAYSSTSMEYKVVHTYRLTTDSNLRCDILTVGVDKSWRHVCTRHLSPSSNDLLSRKPRMSEGFIHWSDGNGYTHILSLNVETETIAENPVPQGYEKRSKEYLSTGKTLSMFARCGEFSFECWEMESETGQWTKMYNIDLDAHKCKFEHFFDGDRDSAYVEPAGWLYDQEVVVFHVSTRSRFCIAYNVRTHEIDFFELDSDTTICTNTHVFQVHTNSLVWFT